MEEGKAAEFFFHYLEHLVEDPSGTWHVTKIAFAIVIGLVLLMILTVADPVKPVSNPRYEPRPVIKEPGKKMVIFFAALAIAAMVFVAIVFKKIMG